VRRPPRTRSQELAAAISAGTCTTLVCLGTNPVYDAPADLKFGDLLRTKKPATTIHVGLHEDETAALCDWHFPLAHELESWGDARAHDGTISMQQPLVAPLHGGVSALEFLGWLNLDLEAGRWPRRRDVREGSRHQLRLRPGARALEDRDHVGLRRLVGQGAARRPRSGEHAERQARGQDAVADAGAIAAAVKGWTKPTGREVVLRGCAKMADGRFANNSWMQEIPEPLTKLSWDNAAHLSMATARR
jgi:anaerobic selenocysteine-containing dehydrogenase